VHAQEGPEPLIASTPESRDVWSIGSRLWARTRTGAKDKWEEAHLVSEESSPGSPISRASAGVYQKCSNAECPTGRGAYLARGGQAIGCITHLSMGKLPHTREGAGALETPAPLASLGRSLLWLLLANSGVHSHHERTHHDIARPLLGHAGANPEDIQGGHTERGVGVELHIGEGAIPALPVKLLRRSLDDL
jgi:hypothetical protein